jgi:hypothetical protein
MLVSTTINKSSSNRKQLAISKKNSILELSKAFGENNEKIKKNPAIISKMLPIV